MTKTIEILTMNDHFARSPAQDFTRLLVIDNDDRVAELREHFGLAPNEPIVLQLALPAGPIFEISPGTKIEVREDGYFKIRREGDEVRIEMRNAFCEFTGQPWTIGRNVSLSGGGA